jgi:precorrin-6B methylase 2
MTLRTENLKLLNEAQREQVLMQWEKHQHEDFETDFAITPYGEVLKGFVVRKGVWNPSITSARHHAAYMFYHDRLFLGKTSLDIGCGTGIVGLVMAKYGAKKVVMSDISEPAVRNSLDNVKKFELSNKVEVVKGNLFESIKCRADCITFMQPYFAGVPPKGDTISASMLAPPKLLKDFFSEAPEHLEKDGVIVMPSFSLAGNLNNPAIVGKDYGFNIKTTFIAESATGVQKGKIAVHELRVQ